jgi:hypothetical protein
LDWGGFNKPECFYTLYNLRVKTAVFKGFHNVGT